MDEIRIGLFGLGYRGIHWLRVIQQIEGYRITAIGDIFPALHERAFSELEDREGVAAYTDYQDLLADANVDAVALVVRCEEQGAMAAQALEAGKHVNAEVPAAHTIEDCWRIVVAAERTGLVYQLGEQLRYAGHFKEWRDLVKQGKLGHVAYCEGEYLSYKGTRRYYQDWRTGEFVYPEDLADHPDARPNWSLIHPPIHYLAHDLSAILMVLDDRVVRVTGMGTRAPSYAHPEINRPDIQVALMQTEKDTILRMACGYTLGKAPETRGHHYQMLGTGGSVETGRRWGVDLPKLWLADSQMHAMANIDWRYERTDAPPEALRLSVSDRVASHGGSTELIRSPGYSEPSIDYYVQTAFRDAVLSGRKLEFDVYRAMDTAAPAILAADSIDQGSMPLDVPDFRPSESRAAGQMPANA